MRRFSLTAYRGLSVGCSLLVVAGCRAASAPSPDTGASDLRAVSENYAAAPASKSGAAIVAFYDSAIVVMSPQGRSPVTGLEANRAGWDRLFRGGNPVHTMTTDTVVVASGGDMGYTRGKWTVGVDTPNGRAEAAGEYIAVWRRRDGQWRSIALSAYTFR